VFKVIPPSIRGGNWTESILWSFDDNGIDGIEPIAGVIMDKSGNLYGTTEKGGAYGINATYGLPSYGGTVFELTPPSTAGGNWTESILWNFANGKDAANPGATLIMDASGNLYSTTTNGGAYSSGENGVGGTVFELTIPSTVGGNWIESILWSFANGTDGAQPGFGSLIMDTSGNLYGTTVFGGAYGATLTGGIHTGGTAFEISYPEIVVKPTNLRFPHTVIGSTSNATLRVQNTGTATLIGTVNTPPSPFGLSGSGSFNLAPKTSTTITLTLTPTSTTPTTKVDTVVSNSVNNGTVLFDLQGKGTRDR
jgi:hypothetical protein